MISIPDTTPRPSTDPQTDPEWVLIRRQGEVDFYWDPASQHTIRVNYCAGDRRHPSAWSYGRLMKCLDGDWCWLPLEPATSRAADHLIADYLTAMARSMAAPAPA